MYDHLVVGIQVRSAASPFATLLVKNSNLPEVGVAPKLDDFTAVVAVETAEELNENRSKSCSRKNMKLLHKAALIVEITSPCSVSPRS